MMGVATMIKAWGIENGAYTHNYTQMTPDTSILFILFALIIMMLSSHMTRLVYTPQP